MVATPAAQINENSSLFDLCVVVLAFQKCAFTVLKVLHLRCLQSVFQKHNAESLRNGSRKITLFTKLYILFRFVDLFYYNLFFYFAKQCLYLPNIYIIVLEWLLPICGWGVFCASIAACVPASVFLCVYKHVQLTLIFICLSRSNHVYQIIVNKWAGPFSAWRQGITLLYTNIQKNV